MQLTCTQWAKLFFLQLTALIMFVNSEFHGVYIERDESYRNCFYISDDNFKWQKHKHDQCSQLEEKKLCWKKKCLLTDDRASKFNAFAVRCHASTQRSLFGTPGLRSSQTK